MSAAFDPLPDFDPDAIPEPPEPDTAAASRVPNPLARAAQDRDVWVIPQEDAMAYLGAGRGVQKVSESARPG